MLFGISIVMRRKGVFVNIEIDMIFEVAQVLDILLMGFNDHT